MTRDKSIAIVHRYFWPQNYPYAIMLKDIVESIVSTDTDVTVYSSFSGINDENTMRARWQKKYAVNIQTTHLPSEREASILKKGFNAIRFAFWVVFKLLLNRHDVVMVATTPPVIIAFLVSLISKFKRFKVVYHCQDIHPESLYINESLKSKIIYKILLLLDAFTVRNAWKVIVLSQDMKETFIKRGLSDKNIHVINNFIFKTIKYQGFGQKTESKTIRFLFAGSLGRFQNLETLIKGIAHFRERDDVEFIFLGEGPLKHKIESYSRAENLTNVTFKSQVPVEDALEQMYRSDVGIVSISPGVSTVAFPSKSIMYMSTGLPILAIIDKNSDLSNILKSNQFGVAVEPNIPEITKGINLILKQLKVKQFCRSSIKSYAEENYSRAVILKKLSNLVVGHK
jgi:colanic acid biosynthesis glycosyl transferase WcaI